MAIRGAAAWRDGIDLVEEDHARRGVSSLPKHFANRLLAIADVLRQQLRALHRNEIGPALPGCGFGQQRFAGSGRTMEQDAFGRTQPYLLEQLRVLDRPLDRFAQLLFHRLESADVVPT